MSDTTAIPTITPHNFKLSTLHQSYDFLGAIRDAFFDDPLANCSKETPVDWYTYRNIQYKAFMEYIKRIFTEEFLGIRSNMSYYILIYDKIEDNYNKYLRFFKDLGIPLENTN